MGSVPLSHVSWYRPLALLGLVLLFSCPVGIVRGQSSKSEREDEGAMPLNWKLKTMGGRQFWTDDVHVSGWRVQRNAMTGHHRLIDPNDVRHGWGTFDHCKQALDDRVVSGSVLPNSGKIVVILHGLMRSSNSMEPISQYLKENSDYQVVNMQYASSRHVVARHATDLACLIQNLGSGVTEINFVAHSMGNIVARHYLNDLKVKGEHADSRFHRMVMIGPPNQGSKMAHVLRNNLLFKSLAGVPGIQLGEKWEELEPHLATPEFEFGIIAGGQSESQKLNNFILNGPDDFTVSLEETRLVGARDWLIRPLLHTTMMKSEITLESTLSFLEKGYFISAEELNPIKEPDPDAGR